jgi:hypothetical protein
MILVFIDSLIFLNQNISTASKPESSAAKRLEPTTGIEPVNLFLTKEALYLLSYVGLFSHLKFKNQGCLPDEEFGAGDEIRTRDI